MRTNFDVYLLLFLWPKAKSITINLYFHIKLRMLSKYTTKAQTLTPFAARAFAGASAGSDKPARVLVSGAAG